MSSRATRRPETFEKPAHWDNSPPPEPGEAKAAEADPEGISPTRYGDWVKNGVAVDF
jgi:hypothetical protein